MEGLRYLESTWRPTVGQRWHCKSPKATLSVEIKSIKDDMVLLGVDRVGERWIHLSILQENFFPLIVGNSSIF